MTLRPVLTVAALALTLAACSSGAKNAASSGVHDLPSLSAKLGCTFTEDADTHELFTSDEGTCGDLTVYWFANSAARDNWVKAAAQFGGNSLVGGSWVVAAENPAAVKSAQAVVGGDLK